jgi:hypothetical protein
MARCCRCVASALAVGYVVVAETEQTHGAMTLRLDVQRHSSDAFAVVPLLDRLIALTSLYRRYRQPVGL